jgi:hypothetical protein
LRDKRWLLGDKTQQRERVVEEEVVVNAGIQITYQEMIGYLDWSNDGEGRWDYEDGW